MSVPIPSRLIEAKREGREIAPVDLEAFFSGFLVGDIPEYQMAAFLMAVQFQGLSPGELETLLDLMVHSGEVLDLSHIPHPKIDKHSTGGVGDKTSLVLAPLAGELGLCVPMMSGRGLGHTAGTLDKLEAIPGFRTRLDLPEFRRTLEEVRVAMIGQTREIAPLDRKLYALRDATATVPSVPLISASILSKKLAEGLDGLVLDVKTGKGAFLPELEKSRALARTMVKLGESRGVRTSALITDMHSPLGWAVGNGLETREALRCLQGEGPEDLADLTVALVGEMLFLAGEVEGPEEGASRAREALEGGRAVDRMARMVEIQGGDPETVEDPGRIPRAPEVGEVTAKTAGVVERVDPLALGYGVVALGGGRRKMEDRVDPRVGFVLHVRPGDRVEVGDPLGEVHAAHRGDLESGMETLRDAVTLGDRLPALGDGGAASAEGGGSTTDLGASPSSVLGPLVLETVRG
jgi:pyrimidine-nucleoside phosphorylase